MAEEWLRIVGFSDYEISDLGRVRRGTRILKQGRQNGGYLHFSPSCNGRRVTKSVHRAVLETFVGPCPAGMVCCHGDRNRQNNALNNLRWGTHSENATDAIKHGTHRALHQSGERNHAAKLNADDVSRIREANLFGALQKNLAAIYGVRISAISRIINHVRWA